MDEPPDPLAVKTFKVCDRMAKKWRLVMHEIGLRAVLEARDVGLTPREALELYARGPQARKRRRAGRP